MIEFHQDFVKKNDDLSEIINIVLQTVNQWEIFH